MNEFSLINNENVIDNKGNTYQDFHMSFINELGIEINEAINQKMFNDAYITEKIK